MATADIMARLISDLMRDFALTREQAAGVAGNLAHESGGFNTLQEQGVSGRGGFGYAQWTGPRRRAFEAYIRENGLDPESYDANYGFLKYEIENDPYERQQFEKVRRAQTVDEATRIFSENYLRPGIPRMESRIAYANQAAGINPALTAIEEVISAPTPSTASPALTAFRSETPSQYAPPSPAPFADKMAAQNRVTPASRAVAPVPRPAYEADIARGLAPRPSAAPGIPLQRAEQQVQRNLQRPVQFNQPIQFPWNEAMANQSPMERLLDQMLGDRTGQGVRQPEMATTFQPLPASPGVPLQRSEQRVMRSTQPAPLPPPLNHPVTTAGRPPDTLAGNVALPPGVRPNVPTVTPSPAEDGIALQQQEQQAMRNRNRMALLQLAAMQEQAQQPPMPRPRPNRPIVAPIPAPRINRAPVQQQGSGVGASFGSSYSAPTPQPQRVPQRYFDSQTNTWRDGYLIR